MGRQGPEGLGRGLATAPDRLEDGVRLTAIRLGLPKTRLGDLHPGNHGPGEDKRFGEGSEPRRAGCNATGDVGTLHDVVGAVSVPPLGTSRVLVRKTLAPNRMSA